jgi:hypothetical protein
MHFESTGMSHDVCIFDIAMDKAPHGYFFGESANSLLIPSTAIYLVVVHIEQLTFEPLSQVLLAAL